MRILTSSTNSSISRVWAEWVAEIRIKINKTSLPNGYRSIKASANLLTTQKTIQINALTRSLGSRPIWRICESIWTRQSSCPSSAASMGICSMWTPSGVSSVRESVLLNLKVHCAEKLKLPIVHRCVVNSTTTICKRKCLFAQQTAVGAPNNPSVSTISQ